METIDTFRPKYQAFLESNMSAGAFCGQIGMNESHFYYWQDKICKEAARQNGGFLPVSINNHAGKVILTGGHAQELPHAERHRHQPDAGIIIRLTAAR